MTEHTEFQAAIATNGLPALIALRDHTAAALEGTTSARDKSSLILRLREILAAVDELTAAQAPAAPPDDIEQIRLRRDARRAAAVRRKA